MDDCPSLSLSLPAAPSVTVGVPAVPVFSCSPLPVPAVTFYALSCPPGSTSSAAGVSMLNSLTGSLSLLGLGSVSITTNGVDTIYVSGSVGGTGAGVTQAQLDSLSGWAASAANLFNTGSYLYRTMTGMSGWANGAFYPLGSNPSGYVTTGQLAQVSGVLQSGIAQSGSVLYGDIVGLSGQAAETYATILNLALTGSTLYNYLTGASGALMTQTLLASGLLGTGLNSLSGFVLGMSGALQANINSLSGYGNATFATIVTTNLISGNLIQTGAQLGATIVATGNAAVAHANGIGSIISGNLTATGQTLLTLIANTGQQAWSTALLVSGLLSSGLYNTGALLSAVRVSGSAIIPVANFSGLGGTLVFTSGGFIFVSGAGGGGGSAGVSSLNGLTAAVSIVGTGGITVTVQGQNVVISGDSSISGALTTTGVALGAKIDALSGYFTGLIPSFGSFSFLSSIPTGVDSYFVPFQNYVFTTVPVVNATFETSQTNALYGVSISGRTTTGFWAMLTDTVLEQNLFLDVFVNATNTPNGRLFSYVTGVPTGVDFAYFAFSGVVFPSIPRVVATMETSLFNAQYGISISGRSTSGFFGLFTDTVLEPGLSLDVTASV